MPCDMFLISILASLPILLYFFINWRLSYWKRKGVPQIEPDFLEGNTKDVNRSEIQNSVVFHKFHEYFKNNGHKFGGIYKKMTPVLMVTDLELIKSVLVSDFVHFVNHDIFINEKGDPLSGNLFNLRDDKWRNMRAKLTPTFTTGKLKMMFQTMMDASSGLEKILEKNRTSKEPIDIKDCLTRFTVDIITSVAFGIESKSMDNPDSEFKAIANKVVGPPPPNLQKRTIFKEITRKIKLLGDLVPEWVWIKLNCRSLPQFLEDFFVEVVNDIVTYREKNNVYRKDFMHLLIQLKNIGKVTDDGTIKADSSKGVHLTMKEITAHSFVFFIAGFETSSTAMTYALFHLAQNQDIQDKARNQINAVLEKHNGVVSYDAIMEMQYLEQIILESLRMHPPIVLIERLCTKDYIIPDTDILIEKGTVLNISTRGIHYDPDIYPNPNVFDPDRFSPENKSLIPPMAFLAFGEGPRLCIGLRFGKLQAKVGLCSILRTCRVTLNEKTQLPWKYDSRLHFPNVEGGVWLNLESLE
ncbi:probable cytochrome P450 6a23 isoform X2 [Diabrotica virgifera virgifera]|uniref:Cytochrome P450 6a14 n=1 Tax=Diabrotica virgifera virgifera TaxID=50390 RepID=A0ABM5KR24_DIAVI|nr:probable cytochrome P450 6a23 isoform X2 [Diabrotica virgifera virgifera]